MGYHYSTKPTENCAKAVGLALPISRKESIMVCQAVRGLNVPKAKKLLEEVIVLKRAIRFTKYNDNMGHQAGMASGAYPVSTCTHILKILKNAEANAQFKGLSTANLIIKHANAQTGPTTSRMGRKRVQAKRTHIELILEEVKRQEGKK